VVGDFFVEGELVDAVDDGVEGEGGLGNGFGDTALADRVLVEGGEIKEEVTAFFGFEDSFNMADELAAGGLKVAARRRIMELIR